MVPSLDPDARVDRSPGRREDVLPGRLAIGVGILLGPGVREVDAAEPLCDVALVPAADPGHRPRFLWCRRSVVRVR
jgi:hypothetical protein